MAELRSEMSGQSNGVHTRRVGVGWGKDDATSEKLVVGLPVVVNNSFYTQLLFRYH